MEVPLAEAKARFAEIIRCAENGEDVIVTRHGRPAARITAAKSKPELDRDKLALEIREIQKRARAKAKLPPGFTAANSQDFLYDERGLPR